MSSGTISAADAKNQVLVDCKSAGYGARTYLIIMGVDGKTYNPILRDVVVPLEAGAAGIVVGPVQAGILARKRAQAINMKQCVDNITALGVSIDDLNARIDALSKSRSARLCACEDTSDVVGLGVVSVCIFPLIVYCCCAFHQNTVWEESQYISFVKENAALAQENKPYRLAITNDPMRGDHSRFVFIFAENRNSDPFEGLKVGGATGTGVGVDMAKPTAPEAKRDSA